MIQEPQHSTLLAITTTVSQTDRKPRALAVYRDLDVLDLHDRTPVPRTDQPNQRPGGGAPHQ
jgi:hypothetical protein